MFSFKYCIKIRYAMTIKIIESTTIPRLLPLQPPSYYSPICKACMVHKSTIIPRICRALPLYLRYILLDTLHITIIYCVPTIDKE